MGRQHPNPKWGTTYQTWGGEPEWKALPDTNGWRRIVYGSINLNVFGGLYIVQSFNTAVSGCNNDQIT